MKYIIIYFYLLLSNGIFGKDLRIIGGTDADISEFFYTVSFRDLGFYPRPPLHFCGGAIISNRHILTAAHCMFPYQDKYEIIRIYTSIVDARGGGGPNFRIAHVILHPEFALYHLELFIRHNDIAVVKVVNAIIFDAYLNKINLPTKDIVIGTEGVVSGWGTLIDPDLFMADNLQKLTMTIHDGTNCAFDDSLYPNHGQFCALNSIGTGVCYGDSGSPFVYNNTIHGIVAFNYACAKGEPDVFTKVYYFMDFVTEAMTL